MGRCRHPVPSEGKKRSTEFVFIAGKLIKSGLNSGRNPRKPLFYKGIWRSILGPSTFSKINWAAIIKAIWNNLEKKGELFMLEMLQTGKALYALAAIGAIGAISKLITRSLYKRLIRETDNMAMTKNRNLKALILKNNYFILWPKSSSTKRDGLILFPFFCVI